MVVTSIMRCQRCDDQGISGNSIGISVRGLRIRNAQPCVTKLEHDWRPP